MSSASGRSRSYGFTLLGLAALAPLASAAPVERQGAAAPISAQGPGRTIGLVLTDVRYALYETAGAKEECPAGLQDSEREQFKATPNYMGHLAKFGGTTANRGPNGELANYSPMMIEDPLPFKEVMTKAGIGINLDGTADGRATAKTCKHEKFTSADNQKVDNQMARVLGCVMGWRKTGFMSEFYSKEVETSPFNRQLVEVSGVDDEKNDPEVEIAIYKGRDRLVRTPAGTSFVPFMSHRIDERVPAFTFKTRGKIVDGVLITDPIPYARMPMLQVQIPSQRHLRDMTLRLKLNADGAEGLMSGYENLATWWSVQSKSPGSGVGAFSHAQLFRAAHRYADGYPDPKTGQCTAISVAYQVSAVRAFIVHPPKSDARIAMSRQ